MKFALFGFVCCVIFSKSLATDSDTIDDFKILRPDESIQEDEGSRAFVVPGWWISVKIYLHLQNLK